MQEVQALGIHLAGRQWHMALLRQSASGDEIAGLASHAPNPSAGNGDALPAWGLEEHTKRFAAMAHQEVMSRFWELPRANDEQLRQIVLHRMEADLPLPIGQIAWGLRSSDVQATSAAPLTVLAQAVRKERMDAALRALADAHLEPDLLTSESEGIAALVTLGLELPTGFSAESSLVVVLANPREWLVAVIQAGLVTLLRRITVETERPDLACNVFRAAVETVLPTREISGVLWLGGPATDTHHDVLTRQLVIRVERAKPSPALRHASGAPIAPDELTTYGPAIGLALAALRGKPAVLRLGGQTRALVKPRSQRFAWWFAQPLRSAAIAAALTLLAVTVHLGALSWETAHMRSLLAGYDAKHSLMTKVGPQIRAMERIRAYRLDVEDIFARLCAAMPRSVVVASVELSRDQGLTIKGISGDLPAMFQWIEKLRADPAFANVRLDRTEPGKGGNFVMLADVNSIRQWSVGGGRNSRWR